MNDIARFSAVPLTGPAFLSRDAAVAGTALARGYRSALSPANTLETFMSQQNRDDAQRQDGSEISGQQGGSQRQDGQGQQEQQGRNPNQQGGAQRQDSQGQQQQDRGSRDQQQGAGQQRDGGQASQDPSRQQDGRSQATNANRDPGRSDQQG